MKHKIKNRRWKVQGLGVATLLIFIFSFSLASAQETISTAGGNASGKGGTASYSVGQLMYQTHVATSGSVAQGVQQAYEISIVTGIEQTDINLTISVYPNPTTDYLTLEVKNFELSALSFHLYDMSGKLLQNEKITGNQTSIVMSNLVPAIYFVKVVNMQGAVSQQEVKTFKIIKNQ